jgi:peptide chain release factor 3
MGGNFAAPCAAAATKKAPSMTSDSTSETTAAATRRNPAAEQVARRRTFAIISHPDAGKTTLTEKLLLFGGAIQAAGQVKAKAAGRNTRSDWMAIERARGISVATSVMTFEYGGAIFNLLDTPGHEDFSDHTYRTLTAVDAAIMVIDAARGIEARTRKLFEICRLRDIPIITFVNKLDRDGREPFELLDEIETSLQLETAPKVWPIGRGRHFKGTYDLTSHTFRQIDLDADGLQLTGPDDPAIDTALEADDAKAWRDEVALVDGACNPFDVTRFLQGTQTPVYFGSALRNFGVHDLLDALITFAPPPSTIKAATRTVDASEPAMTGLIFKIQANMDPNHRDRIAFMRVCSGKLTRGMKMKVVRSGKTVVLQAPQFFFAQDRSLAEEAYAGDIVGIPNKGVLRIGDTVSEGEDLTFVGIPSFAPEILRHVRMEDAIRSRKLWDALREMAEEGVVQIFTPLDGATQLVGVVGGLQLDVLGDRLKNEYNLPIAFEGASAEFVRWIRSDDPEKLAQFKIKKRSSIATDLDGDHVFLANSSFDLKYTADQNPGIRFLDVKTTEAG